MSNDNVIQFPEPELGEEVFICECCRGTKFYISCDVGPYCTECATELGTVL